MAKNRANSIKAYHNLQTEVDLTIQSQVTETSRLQVLYKIAETIKEASY